MTDNILLNKKILLIEDNPLIAKATENTLKKEGVHLLVANEPELAMKLFKDNSDIDLILSDIDLGTEIDGTDLAQIFLSKRQIPLVFLSSRNDAETISKTECITSYGYIEKNTGEAVLIASVKLAFKLHGAKMESQKSESLYKSLFLYYPSPLYIFDMKTFNFLSVNNSMTETYGYSSEDFLRMKLPDIIPTDDCDAFCQLATSASKQLNYLGEWKNVKKGGEIFKVNIISHPITWHRKEANVIIVTELKRNEFDIELSDKETQINE